MTTHRFVDERPALDGLYADMAAVDLQPLWLLEGLMPSQPSGPSRAHVWRGSDLRALGERAGELVPIEEGGDRRVLALANPGLSGRPYATSSLWGAVQFLGPGEVAPAHRHSPAALRFVLAGEGVWTIVEGDAIAMAPGDLVLTPSGTWHEHVNAGSSPMLWFDGLDLPVIEALDAVFFDNKAPPTERPELAPTSASERRYGAGPGLIAEVAVQRRTTSPLYAYRWSDTDRALSGLVASSTTGGASLRYCDPSTGRDVTATMRCSMHRLSANALLAPERRVGSSLFVVFRGSLGATVAGRAFELLEGDILAVPSFAKVLFTSKAGADVFCVSDAPIVEALGLDRPIAAG